MRRAIQTVTRRRNQLTELTIANSIPPQFTIKDLLIATLLIAVMAVITPTVRRMLPEYRFLVFWTMIVVAAGSARWVGWRLCWPPGCVGRHAVAFFFAAMGSAAMIIALNYNDSFSRLMRDVRDGLGVAAFLSAIVIAAIVESASWLLTGFWAAIIEGGLTPATTDGEQTNERAPE